MRKLRKLIGVMLLAAIASLGVTAVSADTGPIESPGVAGPIESPGAVGPIESPGLTTELAIYLATTFTH